MVGLAVQAAAVGRRETSVYATLASPKLPDYQELREPAVTVILSFSAPGTIQRLCRSCRTSQPRGIISVAKRASILNFASQVIAVNQFASKRGESRQIFAILQIRAVCPTPRRDPSHFWPDIPHVRYN